MGASIFIEGVLLSCVPPRMKSQPRVSLAAKIREDSRRFAEIREFHPILNRAWNSPKFATDEPWTTVILDVKTHLAAALPLQK